MSARTPAWRGAQGLAAVGVLVSMVVARAVLLAGSFFNQDDFYLTGRAYRADLTWSFLFRDTAGHVNPLQQLTYWLVAHRAPYDWPVVATGVLAVETASAVVLWLVLTRLLGDRWARVALLAVFAWAPLTLVTTLWWSAAMGLWPHLLCSLLGIWLLVRWHEHGGRGVAELTGIVVVTLVGLAWHERAVLIPPLLFGVAVALVDARGPRRLWRALVRFRLLWVALGGLVAAYLVVHGRLAHVEGGASSLSGMLRISRAYLGENVVPGLVGGPWTGTLEGGAVRPATWVAIVSLVLALAVAGLLVRHGGPGRWWALAVLVGYVAADLALLLSGRAGFGRIIGLDPRYSADVLHAAVVCAALALRGADPAPRDRSPRVRGAALLVAVGGYGVASAFGTALLVPHFQNTEDREFLTTLRAELAADPTQVLVDHLAPADVVLPLVGEDSQLSRILAPLPELVAFDQPSARLRSVSRSGELQQIDLASPVTARPGPDGACGRAVRTRPEPLPFRVPLRGRVVVRIAYFSAREATVTASTPVGSWSGEFLARRGPNVVWLVLPDLGHEVGWINLSGDGRSTVCVTAAEAGLPEAP